MWQSAKNLNQKSCRTSRPKILKSINQKKPTPKWWWCLFKRKKSRSWKSKMKPITNFSNNIILRYSNKPNNWRISVRMAKLYNWNGQKPGKITIYVKTIARTSLRNFVISWIHLTRLTLQPKTYSTIFSILAFTSNCKPKRQDHKKSIKSWRKKPQKYIRSSNNLSKSLRWNKKIAINL